MRSEEKINEIKEEVIKNCLSTDFNKTMGLLEVLKVISFLSKYKSSLEIFLNKNVILSITPLHSFIVIRDGEELCLRAEELNQGDKIWIDIHAFSIDGSLYVRGI